MKYSLAKIAKVSANKTVSYYAPRVQNGFPHGMYYALSHAMHNTANQQVKTRCIFCGTQRIVFSKNPSDLCSPIIFPPKNMPGGTLYKKKKTRILTFISTS